MMAYRIGRHDLCGELAAGSLGRRFRTNYNGRDAVLETISIRCEGELFDRALRRLELMTAVQHDHLVPVLDAGLDGDQLFIVTPQPERTADSCLPMGIAARGVIAAVANAVVHLHRNGAVHRDIQPRHIGWYDGVVKLGGFALADVQGAGQTQGIGPIGGVTTMAPSLVRGARATAGSDVYSLGATLHLLATGVAVHRVREESLAKRIGRIGDEPPVISLDVSAALAPLIRAALDADGGGDQVAERVLGALSYPRLQGDAQ